MASRGWAKPGVLQAAWTLALLFCCGQARGDVQSPSAANADAPSRTAAFLDLDRSPLAALVEQRLLEVPSVVWVERSDIDKVLRERELTTLMGPAACAERSALGRTLKAGALVVLRELAEPEPHVHMVVCETRRGLRLGVHWVARSADVEDDAQRLAALAAESLAAHRDEVREICAVPPFVSHDLTYEMEHLRQSFAWLVEQAVTGQAGVLVVELEEARAIAEEARLTGGDVSRLVPLYLLGDYRHEGPPDRRLATVRMLVKRGEQELGKRWKVGMTTAEATDFVRATTAELLEATIGLKPLAPDAELEASQLARRAETFFALGNWDEAATLAEASLMLRADQKPTHQLAALSLAGIVSREAYYRNSPDRIARGLHLHLRAIEHYEKTLPAKDPIASREETALFSRVRLAACWGELLKPEIASPEVRAIAAEMHDREGEAVLPILLARCRAETGDARQFMNWLVDDRPPKEQFDLIRQVIAAIRDAPDAERLVSDLTVRGLTVRSALDSPEGRAHLDHLSASDSAAVRRAAERLRTRLEHELSREPWRPTDTLRPPLTGSPARVRFIPLDIPWRPAESRPLFGSWIPLAVGGDLVCVDDTVSRMGRPGFLETLWAADRSVGYFDNVRSMKYDGRFAWITTTHVDKKPRLLAVEVASGRIIEVTDHDGLPLVAPPDIPGRHMSPRLLAEPIEPGKAVVVSWFGRLAIGTVTVHVEKPAEVDMFFEGRIQPDSTDIECWRNPQLAAIPLWTLGCRGTAPDGSPLRRVLLMANCRVGQYGRLIDTDARTVRVVEASIPWDLDPRRCAIVEDAAYYIGPSRTILHLWRLGIPDFAPEPIVSNVPEGWCRKHGDHFMVLGSKWWLLDPREAGRGGLHVLAAELPWSHRNSTTQGREIAGEADGVVEELQPYTLEGLWQTNSFGMVAVRRSLKNGHEAFRVIFEDSEPAPDAAPDANRPSEH